MTTLAGDRIGAGFWLLWTGQLTSMLGSQVQYIALPLWVLSVTGSASAVGAAFAVGVVPLIVLGPWAGVVADRFPRRALLVTCELLSVAAVGLVLVGATVLASLPVALLGAAVVASLNAVSVPAFQGLLRETVAPAAIPKATSYFTGLIGAASVLGPPIGSALFAWHGLGPVLVVNALSFAVSAASLVVRREGGEPVAGTSVRPHPLLGYRTVRAEPRLGRLLLAETAYFLFGGGLSVLIIEAAAQYAGDARAGWYLSAVGVAWLLVSLVVVPRWKPAPRAAVRLGAAALFAAALAVLVISAVPTASVLLAGLFAGCANALVVVGANIAWQRETREDLIGQVMAVRRSLTNAGLALSSVGLPFLARYVPLGALVTVGSCATAILIIWLVTAPREEALP